MDQEASEISGKVPKNTEAFGSIPKDAETFGTIPKHAEGFGTVRKLSERKDSHTLTVREVARLFEQAGVARTERSIINWCQLNGQGVARLDAYFDPNERKYFITPQSVELAIAEEKAKLAKTADAPSETSGNIPNMGSSDSEPRSGAPGAEPEQVTKLQKEVLDLKILNRGKDFLIDQLRQERQTFFDQVLAATHKVGELETKLLQLETPESRSAVSDDPQRKGPLTHVGHE